MITPALLRSIKRRIKDDRNVVIQDKRSERIEIKQMFGTITEVYAEIFIFLRDDGRRFSFTYVDMLTDYRINFI